MSVMWVRGAAFEKRKSWKVFGVYAFVGSVAEVRDDSWDLTEHRQIVCSSRLCLCCLWAAFLKTNCRARLLFSFVFLSGCNLRDWLIYWDLFCEPDMMLGAPVRRTTFYFWFSFHSIFIRPIRKANQKGILFEAEYNNVSRM